MAKNKNDTSAPRDRENTIMMIGHEIRGHFLLGNQYAGDIPAHCSCGDGLRGGSFTEHLAEILVDGFPYLIDESPMKVDFSIGDRVTLTGASWPEEHDAWVAPARGTTHTVTSIDKDGRALISFIEPESASDGGDPIELEAPIYVSFTGRAPWDYSATLT